MLDKLLKLNSIHEVRKTLKANDIVGDQVSKLESEWLAAKELETAEVVITNTDWPSIVEAIEENTPDASEEILEEEPTTNLLKSLRGAKFSK
jgi:hypothetical protein